MLATGANVVVCGSHALMHERAATRATSVATLREMFGDRRDRKERRDGTADELGARLIEAFVGDRRRTDERRSL
jgi:hypothetical protein